MASRLALLQDRSADFQAITVPWSICPGFSWKLEMRQSNFLAIKTAHTKLVKPSMKTFYCQCDSIVGLYEDRQKRYFKIPFCPRHERWHWLLQTLSELNEILYSMLNSP